MRHHRGKGGKEGKWRAVFADSLAINQIEGLTIASTIVTVQSATTPLESTGPKKWYPRHQPSATLDGPQIGLFCSVQDQVAGRIDRILVFIGGPGRVKAIAAGTTSSLSSSNQ